MNKIIQISKPSLGEDEWQALKTPIMSGWLAQGSNVQAFEKAFADIVHSPHASAVTSCTTALHLALLAVGVGVGDEVIVPALSWISTANAVEYCGAKPVFVDVNPDTFNIDAAQIAGKITDKTKAIVPVHLFGLCADMDAIRTNIPDMLTIIEDAACAAGALYNGKPAGTLGKVACFSFHPRKSITTGEGGMITTADQDIHNLINVLRNHGASVSEAMINEGAQPYLMADFDVLGYNYRMTDIQAAIGLVQLEKMLGWIEERNTWADYYHKHLNDVPWLRCPVQPKGYRHSWQAFVTMVDPEISPMSRNKIMAHLYDKGIATRPGTHAIHMLGYYQAKYGLTDDDCPNAKDCYHHSMAIPMHNEMSQDDYDYVIETIKDIR